MPSATSLRSNAQLNEDVKRFLETTRPVGPDGSKLAGVEVIKNYVQGSKPTDAPRVAQAPVKQILSKNKSQGGGFANNLMTIKNDQDAYQSGNQ